jgi:uncharacterized protein (TIGR03118 family)
MVRRVLPIVAALGLVVLAAAPASARNINAENTYTVQNLVSDNGAPGSIHDGNLVNGWGIVAGPTTPWWVADNGTDKSTLYTGAGAIVPIVVNVDGGPTGIVFNGISTDFVITSNGVSGAARFIWSTEGGQILGWNPNVPGSPVPSDQSFLGTTVPGAIYKGLAIATKDGKQYLYAANFHDARVDVFDSSFSLQNWAGAFVDPRIPDGYAPFGIQTLNGMVFVTYAKQDADAEDEIAGKGLGFVDAFGADGSFLGRVASRHALNAPWGLAWAPADFGKFSGDLLVGNFGDGTIHAFAWTRNGWKSQGTLRDASHHKLVIDGLWGIGFGNGSASGPVNVLYFAAGPDDESHGLFGSITGP